MVRRGSAAGKGVVIERKVMKRRNVFQGVLAALFTGLVMPLKGKAWDVETIPSGDDLQKGIAALRNIVEIQTSDGNWNSSPYMQGMANGLIFALSLFERGRPQYLDPPDKWLSGEQSWTTEGAVKRLSDAFRIDPNFA